MDQPTEAEFAPADVIKPLGDDVYEIDTRMAGCANVTAGYLILGDRPCLVETGSATSAPVVRAALGELGVSARDLATVVVTHIHLDHAGGVGDIAAAYPEAEVYVHEKGARHLADPSRLVASSRMVFGEWFDHLFGELRPTEAHRIRALGESGSIDLGGGRRLDSHYSPGHAKHHVGLLDSRTGDLYVGDAVGIYLPETGDVRPATPPPDFNLEAALKSLGLFEALDPQRLLFAHYGPVSEVTETLERSAEELRVWTDLTRTARSDGLDLDHAIAMVLERTKDRYRQLSDAGNQQVVEMLSNSAANVAGIWRYLELEDAAAADR